MENIKDFDLYIVNLSGGKDSVACFLHLLELGIPKEKIEVWHQIIDGREGSTLMDWPVTEDYCRKFAAAFGVPIYFQWREGGFEKELTRDKSLTGGIHYELPNGTIAYKPPQDREKYYNTRMKFPQVSGDLSVRWCSGYLKIDISASAIRNQSRFDNIRTLVISGERGEESAQRAKYEILEQDKAGTKSRYVVRWRPILHWLENKVWEIMERFRVLPHPCYYLGFSRCSCRYCIFGSANQFATVNAMEDPEDKLTLQNYEDSFGVTMKRNESIKELIQRGTVSKLLTPELKQILMSTVYSGHIILSTEEEWILPPGAYGENFGPI